MPCCSVSGVFDELRPGDYPCCDVHACARRRDEFTGRSVRGDGRCADTCRRTAPAEARLLAPARSHLSSRFLPLPSSAPRLFWLRCRTLTSALPVSLLFPLKCLMAVSTPPPNGACGPWSSPVLTACYLHGDGWLRRCHGVLLTTAGVENPPGKRRLFTPSVVLSAFPSLSQLLSPNLPFSVAFVAHFRDAIRIFRLAVAVLAESDGPLALMRSSVITHNPDGDLRFSPLQPPLSRCIGCSSRLLPWA